VRRFANGLFVSGIAGVILAANWIQSRFRSRIPLFDLIDVKWLLAYTLLMMGALSALGVPGPFQSRLRAVGASFVGVSIASLIFSFVSQLFGPWLLPRPVVIFFSPVACFSWAVICSHVHSVGWIRDTESCLLVGSVEDKHKLEQELVRQTLAPAKLVAFIDSSLPIGHADLATQLRHGVSLVILSEEVQRNEELIDTISDAHATGVRVRTLSGFYEQWLGKLPLTELARMNLLFDVGDIHGSAYRRVKRGVDMLAGIGGALVMVPVLVLVLVGNLFSNRGPLFFRQPRVGEGGSNFEIYKFRTMVVDQESPGTWTQENDPRITKFGKFLRKSHLDELPQFLNLLRGDISLVGPRPEQPHYVELLTTKIHHYGFRHSVKPGLTGWAQIRYPYGSTEEDALEKLEYELYYLAHQSFVLDTKIAARTFSHFLFGQGR
jgi:exopolysaccharide biosynthesis polyprenyl glycosylphosphotransferase